MKKMLHPQLMPYQTRINQFLERCLPDSADRLHQAMRYSVLGGGKRLRPLLVYAAGKVAGMALPQLDNIAAAVELIHAYSLIHDDLPAMDNDDLRHGQPACHKIFGEGTAILAGDALQSLAFEILAGNQNVAQVVLLAKAVGAQGMVLGQSLDIQATDALPTLQELATTHRYKTGALISASIQLGAMDGNAPQAWFQALLQFAECLGLAFQIQDDILDVESSTEILGKRQGADIAQQKITYVSMLGLPQAKQQLAALHQQILAYLAEIPQHDLLKTIVAFIMQREY